MLPEDLETQVKHFRGELSGSACTLFESFAKRIKLLESKVNCSRTPAQPPKPTPPQIEVHREDRRPKKGDDK